MAYNELDKVSDCWDQLPLARQIFWAGIILWDTWDAKPALKKIIFVIAVLALCAATIVVAYHNWAAGLVMGILLGLVFSEIRRVKF